MGDAAISQDSAILWMRLEGAYAELLRAIVVTQSTGPNDGSLPDIVPYIAELWPGDPVWTAALPLIAWRLFEHTGDVSLLRPVFNATLRYHEWQAKSADKDGLLDTSPHGA